MGEAVEHVLVGFAVGFVGFGFCFGFGFISFGFDFNFGFVAALTCGLWI